MSLHYENEIREMSLTEVKELNKLSNDYILFFFRLFLNLNCSMKSIFRHHHHHYTLMSFVTCSSCSS